MIRDQKHTPGIIIFISDSMFLAPQQNEKKKGTSI